MFKIIVADALPADLLEKYNQEKDMVVDNRSGISAAELKSILPEYDGLVVRSRTKITADLLDAGERLKIIGRAGAGVDNIQTDEATRRGIIVMNTPGGNTIAAAEHSVALLLAALRNIPRAFASMQEKQWDRKSFLGNELYEKTVGVVGLGKIGREVARRLAAFGTNLIGFDPILTREVAGRLGIELVGFGELLARSDIITMHVPKMPETLNMINAERLQQCRDGVILVNCARGGIINEADLLAALESGKVGLAAIDVFESEPPADWSLATHPRVVATPHLGASTEEAQAKVAEQILQQMCEYHRKQVARNAVNFISVDEKIQPVIAPYFQLAQKLGTLFSQIREGRLQEVALRFYGDVVNLPLEPVASHLMAGALKNPGGDPRGLNVDLLNMVNSLSIAREKGIDIEISKKDHPLTNHTNLVACDFRTDSGIIHIAGTVYAPDNYRLIEFGPYDVDADLADLMVIVENDDVPGIIGNVGTLLGEKSINISHVSSGRLKSKRTAVNIFNVENHPEPSLITRLQAIEHVSRVRAVDMTGKK